MIHVSCQVMLARHHMIFVLSHSDTGGYQMIPMKYQVILARYHAILIISVIPIGIK